MAYFRCGSGGLSGGVIPIGYDEYQALSPEEKADEKKAYIIDETITEYVYADIDFYSANAINRENSMQISPFNQNQNILFTWEGGSSIGATVKFLFEKPILSGYTKFRYKVTTGNSSYYNTNGSNIDRFRGAIGVSNTSYNIVFPDLSYSPDFKFDSSKTFTQLNTVYEGEIDLENISGLDLNSDVYLYISGNGWNMSVDLDSKHLQVIQPKSLIYYQNGQFIKNQQITPTHELLYEWDFTQSLTDLINGEEARIDNATLISGEGIKNDTNNPWGNVLIFTQKDYDLEGKTVEIDFDNLSMLNDGAYDHHLISISHKYGEYGEKNSGFYPRPNWTASLRNAIQTYTETSQQTVFSDCTFKFIFTHGHMTVYVDDILFYDGGTIIDGESNFQIGLNWGDFTVTGLRIYMNE